MIRIHAIALSIVTTLAVATQSFAQAAAWPSDQAGLNALATTLVNGFFTTIAAKDWAGLELLLQPNFQRINFQGSFDRAGEIAQTKGLNLKSPTISDVIATRIGDALVVTCAVLSSELAAGDQLPVQATLRLGVWQIVNGAAAAASTTPTTSPTSSTPPTASWQLAAWASLNMPDVRPAPGAPSFAGDSALNAEGAALLQKFLTAQQTKKMDLFDDMLADGMHVVNFKGQKARADMIRGAKAAKTQPPVIADARATRCGDLTIVTCNLTMGQSIAFTTLPADPAPFMAIFQGTGDAAKVIGLANTNKPK